MYFCIFLSFSFHLQGWAFKARFPEDNISSSMIANSAVIVGEGDPRGSAGDGHPRQWVALRVRALARCGDVWQVPVLDALAPHVDRAVLAQGATVKPLKIVAHI